MTDVEENNQDVLETPSDEIENPENGGEIQTKKKRVKIPTKEYNKELIRLQTELVKLEQWIIHKKMKVVVIFEGRDTAGKGGTIKRGPSTDASRVDQIHGVLGDNPPLPPMERRALRGSAGTGSGPGSSPDRTGGCAPACGTCRTG